jgi:hypothetical protein
MGLIALLFVTLLIVTGTIATLLLAGLVATTLLAVAAIIIVTCTGAIIMLRSLCLQTASESFRTETAIVILNVLTVIGTVITRYRTLSGVDTGTR